MRFATELKPPADRALHLSAPVWLTDRLFIHDRLQAGEVPPSVAEVVAASDFDHVGEMGMSFGGSTTGAVCMVDQRCAAAVNLDGGDFDFTPFDRDLPVPMLMLHSDLSLFYRMLGVTPPTQPRSFNDFAYESLANAGQNPRIHRLVMRDTLHAGLTDNALYLRRPLRDKLIGSAPTDVLIEAPATLVLGFFDHYLRGHDNGFPQAQMAHWSDWVTPYRQPCSEPVVERSAGNRARPVGATHPCRARAASGVGAVTRRIKLSERACSRTQHQPESARSTFSRASSLLQMQPVRHASNGTSPPAQSPSAAPGTAQIGARW
ncbi:MAG: hypothetical protein QM805_20905 [Pseudomonas sp.]